MTDVPRDTQPKEDSVDPQPEDVADTLSAAYRGMRDMSMKFDAILSYVILLQLSLAIMAGVLFYFAIRRLTH